MEGVENDPATSTRVTPAPLSMPSAAEIDEPSLKTPTSVQVSSSPFKRGFNIGYYVNRRDDHFDPPKVYTPRSFEKPRDVLSPSVSDLPAVGTSSSVSNN